MRNVLFPFIAAFSVAIIGCESSAPKSPAEQVALKDDAHIALEKMEAQDPTLAPLLKTASGYAIFPDVGAAAVGVGGASGRGEVYKAGQLVGEVTLNQASIGFQIGGNTFDELIVFQNEQAINRLMNDSTEFGADAHAQVLKAGSAGSSNFADGIGVYVQQRGGLMAGVNVNGQKFHFIPAQGPTTRP